MSFLAKLQTVLLLCVLTVLFFFVGKSAYADTTGTLLPSGEGAYMQWAPSTGSSHYAVVDESSCNGNTDFNRETTVGQRDSYALNLTSIPNGATITQISITPCASKNTAGGINTTFDVFYRLNGVNSADMPGYMLTGTTPTPLAVTNYTGLSIVKGVTTTLEIGGIYTAGNKGVKLSQIGAVITYNPPAPSVTTSLPSGVLQTSATLNSSVNPNGNATTVLYRYGTTNTSCALLPNGIGAINIGSGTAAVSPNSQSVASLSANTTYYYCATATNSGGTSYGNVISFTTLQSAPVAPSGLSVTPNTSTSAVLLWADNSNNENGFRIERSYDGVFGWMQVGTASANTTTFTDQNLITQQPYYYRVYAFNAAGNSGYTNVYSINSNIPNNPSNVTLTLTSCGEVPAAPMILSWQDNSFNEIGYEIETSVDGSNYSPLVSLGSDSTSYSFNGSNCSYRIRAVNGNGNSDWAYVDTMTGQ